MLGADGLWPEVGLGGELVGGDLLEQVAQVGDALGAVAVGPALFDLLEEAGADAAGDFALGGEADQLGAAVGGVGEALDVAEADEVVDDLPRRLLGDAGPAGELGQAHAV